MNSPFTVNLFPSRVNRVNPSRLKSVADAVDDPHVHVACGG